MGSQIRHITPPSIIALCHPERSGWYAKRSSHGVEGPLHPSPDLSAARLSPNQPLSYRMNEIRIRRLTPRCPHLQRNLPPMIGRMHYHMHEYVLDATRPRLAFAVSIFDRLVQSTRLKLAQVFPPRRTHVVRQHQALLDCRRRPYRHALRFAQNSFQPKPLGRQNMRHAPDRAAGNRTGRAHRSQALPIRPVVINKHSKKIVVGHWNPLRSSCASIATSPAKTIR